MYQKISQTDYHFFISNLYLYLLLYLVKHPDLLLKKILVCPMLKRSAFRFLYQNDLSGTIPAEISALVALEQL